MVTRKARFARHELAADLLHVLCEALIFLEYLLFERAELRRGEDIRLLHLNMRIYEKW